VIVDTSALTAFFHPKEPHHEAVSALFDRTTEPLIVSPLVVAELDYLVLTRAGVRNEVAVIRELLSPAWRVERITDDHLAAAADLVERYADQAIDLTDALNVVLAAAHHTAKIATLDHRHFDVLRLPDGKPIEIVP
jgi:predicted nucleic acid-binding protein